MSLIRPFFEQTRATFLSLPMPSRVIFVMLVVAIALGLAMLVRGETGTRSEYLLGGRTLGEQELDSVELAFARAGLNRWEREGRRVKIPVDTRGDYLAALDNATLPLSLRTPLQKAMQEASVFESSEMRRTREMHAKEISLGKKIEAFPDVRYASVEYSVGERVGLGRKRSQSASVIVVPEGIEPLQKNRINAIKDLVRGSYADMTPESVVVIDTNGTSSSSLSDEEDLLRRRREEEEASYVLKVRKLLYELGDIKVAAYAEIDPTMDSERAVLKYDEQPTTIGETTRKVASETTRPLNQGVPGAATNVTQNRPLSLEENSQRSKTSEDERQSTRVAGQQYEQSRLASLQTKRVRITVGLPDSYYRKVWASKYPKLDPDDPESVTPADFTEQIETIKRETKEFIKQAVSPILPDISVGEDKFDQLVEVWDYPDLPTGTYEDPQLAAHFLTWLAESWQTLALAMLGIVALLVARSAVRGGTGDASPAEFGEGFGLELPPPPATNENDRDAGETMTITGVSLRDELTSLVEKNPEVAANVIRSWVGEAA